MSKQFPPSQRRLLQSRKEGTTCKSSTLTTAVGLTSCIYLLYFFRNSVLDIGVPLVKYPLAIAPSDPRILIFDLIFLALTGAGLFITIITSVFLLAEIIQLGGKIYLGSVYNGRGGFLFQGVNKVGNGLRQVWQLLLQFLIGVGVLGVLIILNFPLRIFVISFVFLLFGLSDWGLRYWKRHQQLKMTMKELMDELKSTEGDPYIKAKRQALQRAIANESLEVRVKRAKVIIIDRNVNRRSSKIYRRAPSAF